MADPSAVSVIIPAFEEGAAVADVITTLQKAAAWGEIIVVDDG
jgi:glycosyltransferase involved in cell wall biosynthesis